MALSVVLLAGAIGCAGAVAGGGTGDTVLNPTGVPNSPNYDPDPGMPMPPGVTSDGVVHASQSR